MPYYPKQNERVIPTDARLEFAPSPDLAPALARFRAKAGPVALHSTMYLPLHRIASGGGPLHIPEEEVQLQQYIDGLERIKKRRIALYSDVTARMGPGLEIDFPLAPSRQMSSPMHDTELPVESDTPEETRIVARFSVPRSELVHRDEIKIAISGLVHLLGLHHPSRAAPGFKENRDRYIAPTPLYVHYTGIHEPLPGSVTAIHPE